MKYVVALADCRVIQPNKAQRQLGRPLKVLDLGCAPEEEQAAGEDPKPAVEPTDPTDRQNALLGAIAVMVERNARDDFGANGAPSIKALNDALGWKPSAEERDTAWLEYQTKD